jgi:hypothetical protein
MDLNRLIRFTVVGALASIGMVGISTATASASNSGTSVIYSSLVASPLPGNLPSEGPEAYAFNEFGNEVSFATGTNRQLTNVVLEMSSWGCVNGHWFSSDCVTPAGSTFQEPITLNIYNPPSSLRPNVPGTLIKSVTQTFSIPYRPSTSAKCTNGRWWDSSAKTCYNGLATNVTFNLGGVLVPNTVVYGVVYNTSDIGPAPYGSGAACVSSSGGCGYDSLNIAFSVDPNNVIVGTDSHRGTVWQNSPYGGQYCDGGTGGLGTFRLDSPGGASCWGIGTNPADPPYYVPAIQFKAGAVGHSAPHRTPACAAGVRCGAPSSLGHGAAGSHRSAIKESDLRGPGLKSTRFTIRWTPAHEGALERAPEWSR